MERNPAWAAFGISTVRSDVPAAAQGQGGTARLEAKADQIRMQDYTVTREDAAWAEFGRHRVDMKLR